MKEMSTAAAMLADLARSKLNGADVELLGIEPLDAAETFSLTRQRVPAERFPYFNYRGERTEFYRLRFLSEVRKFGVKKTQRYWQPPATAPQPYLPTSIDWAKVFDDPTAEIIITEGEKKSAKGCKESLNVIGLGGIWNYRSKARAMDFLPLLETVPWHGRRVMICFDTDKKPNEDVEAAAALLSDELTKRGAIVSRLRLPLLPRCEKTGLDDYLAAKGAKAFRALKPEPTLIENVKALKFDTAAALLKRDVKPVRAIVHDLLYPGAYVFTGRAKIGKSYACLQLSIMMTNGKQFLDEFVCEHAEVLAIFAEDSDERIKARLTEHGVVNLPQGIHLINRDDFHKHAKRYSNELTLIQFLEAWLEAHPKVKLVIVDTETVVRQVWLASAKRKSSSARRIRITNRSANSTSSACVVASRFCLTTTRENLKGIFKIFTN